jgi:hypothetical protein
MPAESCAFFKVDPYLIALLVEEAKLDSLRHAGKD